MDPNLWYGAKWIQLSRGGMACFLGAVWRATCVWGATLQPALVSHDHADQAEVPPILCMWNLGGYVNQSRVGDLGWSRCGEFTDIHNLVLVRVAATRRSTPTQAFNAIPTLYCGWLALGCVTL